MNYRYKKSYRPSRYWKERRDAALIAYEKLDEADKAALDDIVKDIEPTMRNAGKDTVLEILAAIGMKINEIEERQMRKSILREMVKDQGFFRLADGRLDRIFTEALFGFALYQRSEGNTYKHVGVCGSFEDAFAWMTGDDSVEIVKVYGGNDEKE